MDKVYSFALTLLVGAASLSSCSRANYAFDNKVPAYQGAEQVATAQAAMAPEVAVKTAGLPVVESQTVEAVAPAAAAPVVAKALANGSAKAARPSLTQRLLVKHVAKQLSKVARSQNTARTEQTAASKTGRAALVALAGLVLILLGAAVNVGIIATIGAIAFLVGIILVVVHLVSGD